MAPYSCNRQSAAAILRGLMAQDRMTRIIVLDQSLSFPFRPLPAACKLRNPAQEKVSEPSKEIDAKGYWRDVIRLTLSLLVIWFVVSYGAGILFRDLLDNLSIGGAPLGFWFAQNGSIYVFVGLIFYYCRAMNRLEKKYGVEA